MLKSCVDDGDEDDTFPTTPRQCKVMSAFVSSTSPVKTSEPRVATIPSSYMGPAGQGNNDTHNDSVAITWAAAAVLGTADAHKASAA